MKKSKIVSLIVLPLLMALPSCSNKTDKQRPQQDVTIWTTSNDPNSTSFHRPSGYWYNYYVWYYMWHNGSRIPSSDYRNSRYFSPSLSPSTRSSYSNSKTFSRSTNSMKTSTTTRGGFGKTGTSGTHGSGS